MLGQRPGHIGAALKQGMQRLSIELAHIQPGKLFHSAYIEYSYRSLRAEVPNRQVFTVLGEVRRMAEDWCHRRNHHPYPGCTHSLCNGTIAIRLCFRMTRKNEDASPRIAPESFDHE